MTSSIRQNFNITREFYEEFIVHLWIKIYSSSRKKTKTNTTPIQMPQKIAMKPTYREQETAIGPRSFVSGYLGADIFAVVPKFAQWKRTKTSSLENITLRTLRRESIKSIRKIGSFGMTQQVFRPKRLNSSNIARKNS